MEIKGIFVTRISKSEAKQCFDEIRDRYENNQIFVSGNIKQQMALLKTYCHDINAVIDKVFFGEMYGSMRCKRKISELSFKPIDKGQLQMVFSEIFGIIIELKKIVDNSIPINELPSCKSLTEMGVEDAVSASKDLVGSNIVKSIVSTLLIAVDAGKFIQILDVRKYYNNIKEELEYELRQEQRPPSEIELFLMDKYEAEIGYCNLAGLKVGLSGFKEIADLSKNSQNAIDKFNERAEVKPLSITR